MKKLFVTAIMAIALIAGSATITADNHCKTKCPKTEQCSKKADCTKKKDCKDCTKPCEKKQDCTKACDKKAQCPNNDNKCDIQNKCNQKPCQKK